MVIHSKIDLKNRIDQLYHLMSKCNLCPRNCGANRLKGEVGFCQAGLDIAVSSAFAHFGEEQELVGLAGSGTIFFAHCNLRCIFCQNCEISHGGQGTVITIDQLAHKMMQLQQAGCHNINFVTPTHYTPQIIASLQAAIEMGLRLPLVYNCSGYESVETLQLLDGIIDIYMPDAKFSNPQSSQKYCHTPDYFKQFKAALFEMHRQVGTLQVDAQGIAQRGVLIRHLVMPNHFHDSKQILKFIAEEISTNSYINIMSQYHPCHESYKYEEINRRITIQEFDAVINYAHQLGLHRGF